MEIADDSDEDDDIIEEGDEDDDDEPLSILCSKDVQLMVKTSPIAGYEVCTMQVPWTLHRMSFWYSPYI